MRGAHFPDRPGPSRQGSAKRHVEQHLQELGLQRRRVQKRTLNTKLGAWIEAQKSAAEAGETGADLRLAAANDLQRSLIKIQEGDPPRDIYIRWKKRFEQPVGWHPDTNDGVRINIRPFVEAGVLRSKFTTNWKKDRGKNPDGSERHDECHLTRGEKEASRRDVGG
ncbi:hypothetical protein BH20ACT10_BH20ACT10_25570 [soil metagenome]